jgi:phospholipase C
MPELSRRNVLRGAAITGAVAAASAAPLSGGGEALAATVSPAQAGHIERHGDLRDIKHIVVLMQENRSFDHYFGHLAGVIGYGDRSTIQLPGGLSVWQQPNTPPGFPVTGTQYPWALSAGKFAGAQPPNPEQGAQNYGGTGHSWESQHGAWYGGLMNAWQYAKGGPTTMGYLTRGDIPFHYALAEAYTIGDGYHCSVLSATGPNRTYLWSGTINADQANGSYVANGGGDELGRFLPWTCYSELLQDAGLTWKIYQGSDNYGDNGAQYFKTFAQLDPSQGGTAPAPGTNPFYDNGLGVVPEPLDPENFNGDNLANAIKADVLNGTLAQVSWVVTNQQYSEHPDGAPTDGAYYVGKVLQALNADPRVFNSTLVIVNYDENDGQFDHVPPPVPPQGTTDEFYLETSLAPEPLPVGLGFRVPLILISPWTRGGWVTSEVSDHTSVLQFMEKWTAAIGTPVPCPYISAWRRSVSGDLLNAFDFDNPVFGMPDLPFVTATVGEASSYNPIPSNNQMPVQEPGSKKARALPYQANASLGGVTTNSDGTVTVNLALSNNGPHVRRASHFSVFDNTLATSPSVAAYPGAFPGQYTVAGARFGAVTAVSQTVAGPAYDTTIVSANRFLRRFTGDATKAGAALTVTASYYANGFEDQSSAPGPALLLTLGNNSASDVTFTVTPNHYSADPVRTVKVRAHGSWRHEADVVATAHGWYDVTVTADVDSTWSQRFIGHIENGEDSITGSA